MSHILPVEIKVEAKETIGDSNEYVCYHSIRLRFLAKGKKALEKNKCRIGKKPFFYEVSDEEALDLDNHKDFEYLEYYVKKYLSRSKC